MKITSQKNHKKAFIIIAIVILLGIATSISAMRLLQPKTSTNKTTGDSINLDTPTDSEIKAGQDTKKSTIDNSANANNTPTDNSKNIDVSLQGIQNGNQVVFDTVIQTISNDGQCTLSITSSNQTIEKTASIFANPSSSSCKGFAVSTSELPKGVWNATLNITVGSNTGTSNISVNVE